MLLSKTPNNSLEEHFASTKDHYYGVMNQKLKSSLGYFGLLIPLTQQLGEVVTITAMQRVQKGDMQN